MNSKSLIAALGGGITLFIVGFILYALIFASFFEAHTANMKSMEEVNVLLILVGNLIGGLLLAIIFGSWADIKTFGAGAKAGATFGFLVSLGVDLILYATTNGQDFLALVVDVILTAILFAVAGGVVAALLGRGGAAGEASAAT